MKTNNLNEEQIYDDKNCLPLFPIPRKEFKELIVLERALPCGAQALKRHLHNLIVVPVASVSTISRIFLKHCLTNGRTVYYPED